jgi:hypothetical protein
MRNRSLPQRALAVLTRALRRVQSACKGWATSPHVHAAPPVVVLVQLREVQEGTPRGGGTRWAGPREALLAVVAVSAYSAGSTWCRTWAALNTSQAVRVGAVLALSLAYLDDPLGFPVSYDSKSEGGETSIVLHVSTAYRMVRKA